MKGYLKDVIAWIGLGVSITIWASSNFASIDRVKKNEQKLEGVATREDIQFLREDIKELRREVIEILKHDKH